LGVLTVTALYFFWRALILGADVLPLSKFNYEFSLRLLAIPHTLLTFLQLLVFPVDLHYYRNIDTLAPPGFFFLAVFALAAAVYLFIRRLPAASRIWPVFGIGWFMIAVFPALNLVAIINEYSKIAAFEHFLYLPSAGFFLAALAAAGAFPVKENFRRARRILAGGVLVLCLALTLQQNRYWRSEIALFERMLVFEKDFGRGYRLLGKAYAQAGDYSAAITATAEALRIFRYYRSVAAGELAPGFYDRISKELYLELADYAQAQGDYEQATGYYLATIGLDSRDSTVYNLLGACYARRQMFDKAAKYFSESIRFDPANSQALSNLAVCYIRQKRLTEAKQLLERAVAADKNNFSARDNLAQLLKDIAASR
jgi:protein O-mannosyl-transferase